MRIKITFQHEQGKVIPWDYQYAIQAWIYKILERANPELAAQLHDSGYKFEGKHFKLFCLGQWQCHYKPLGQAGIKLLNNASDLPIGFMLPEVLSEFITGLFKDQSHTFSFKGFEPVPIQVISAQLLPDAQSDQEYRHYMLITGARISIYDASKRYAQYIGPDHHNYIEQVIWNIKRKFNASPISDPNLQYEYDVKMDITSPYKTQKINIPKGDRPTEMIGYKYAFSLLAPKFIHDTLLYAGLGEECSMGMGWVEEVG